MAINYGIRARRITASDIDLVTNTNGTIVSQGNVNSGFEFQWYPNNGGCGATPNSSFSIRLLDPIPWTRITYELYTTGTSSCWNFNSGGNLGNGNLLAFSSSIDRVFYSENSFNLSQYTVQMQACDNATTNFMHVSYSTGTFRKFFVNRRRDSSLSLASIDLELSCNSTGIGSLFILRNIFVW